MPGVAPATVQGRTAQPVECGRDAGPTQTMRTGLVPAGLLPLIGREHQLQQACELLLRPEVRLLTLTGPAGTGKTRLGLAVAAQLGDAFAEGVCLTDLAPIREPRLV